MLQDVSLYSSLSQFIQDPLLQNSSRLLVVHGKHSFDSYQKMKDLKDFLEEKKAEFYPLSGGNPSLPSSRELSLKIKDFKPDLIIAMGGGSVIDSAKTALLWEANEGLGEEEFLNYSSLAPIRFPFLAIPTTAGSGSEATHFSVCYWEGKKYSLAHPSLRPSVVLLHAPFLSSLSPLGLAIPAADAISQAIESLLSSTLSCESSSYSFSSLEKSAQGREEMSLPKKYSLLMEASYKAGCAINLTKTTVAHALSYTLTSHWGIAHGQAVAFFLPAVLEVSLSFPEDLISSKFSLLQEALFPFKGTLKREDIPSFLKELFKKMGLKTSLKEIEVNSDLIKKTLLDEVNQERLKNYFIPLTEKDLREIIERSF